MKQGKVYLVGAGPGSPDLITVKGLDCLKRADVVIYDHLVDESLLDHAPAAAEKIYAGKTASRHALEQAEINRLLVERAKEGRVVVRLKGGDPFVLGRGGEEAMALAEDGIPFEVVPGVSAATAVPAHAGIAVTHRGLASYFTVVTGHEDVTKAESSVPWEDLAKGSGTLVILMGVANLSEIVARLVRGGRPPSTPVAVIRQGSRPTQQTLVGTLTDIASKAESSGVKPPSVIVVGDVVRLREKMRWFDILPLFGKRILVTRARQQAGTLSKLLAERGAMPVELPTLEIQSVPDALELKQALLDLESYDWIVFTSVNGVEAFFQGLRGLGHDARALKGTKVGAIGPATAEALEQRGVCPDYMPQNYTSEGLLAGFENLSVKGCRFLLPRADIAGKELAEGIARLGAKVHEVAVYSTVMPAEVPSEARQMLVSGQIDLITFTSPSAVANLVNLLGEEGQVVKKTEIACIGPTTAAEAVRIGFEVDIVAKEHTIAGLVEAIEQYYQAVGEET
ncbi:MAG: uroporphyrinogen-III C-methyltransferase [Chloroflexi bacterium]|nr:uroporphyrinogen-III C-methyltransferase [Chloroflexota bacterium]